MILPFESVWEVYTSQWHGVAGGFMGSFRMLPLTDKGDGQGVKGQGW